MATLTFDFQAAFDNDTAIVRIDGERALNADAISTDYSIGLATRLKTEVEDGAHHVAIELPNRGLGSDRIVEIVGDTQIAVSCEDDRIEMRLTDGPIVYF